MKKYDLFNKNPCCSWVRNYSDVSECIELKAVYDDVLKKDSNFTDYAVMLANKIIEDLQIENLIATYGKWGARLDTAKNKIFTQKELELFAIKIVGHPAWLNLKASTHVFTYGKQLD